MENPERSRFAYFIPYIAQKNMVVVINSRIQHAQQLLQMQGAQLAVVRGFRHGPTYDRIVEQLMRNGQVTEVATTHSLFLMLKAGNRIDVIFSQPLFYEKELAELGLQSVVTVRDWAVDEAPLQLSLVLSKAHFSEQDYRRMAGLVEDMRADGTLRRIVGRYVSGPTLDSALGY
ncbi:MAG: transporter substrate-binding domain-containing protein [Pseudomonadaceae bacterium]|nr:transporter substrate-binding domain-containing protein [Pseudomonadaceae bacterium]